VMTTLRFFIHGLPKVVAWSPHDASAHSKSR
jgi:hypothetical protein